MFALCLSNANKGSFVFYLLTRETSADYQTLQYAHRKDLFGSYFRIWTIHQIMKLFKGPFIYDVHKKIAFSTPLPLCPHPPTPPRPPSPSVHMGGPPPCGRPHTVNMKYTPLS